MCVYPLLVLTGFESKKLFKWMEWITLAIVLALAVGSFIAATHEHHAKNVMLNNNMHRFLLGLLLSAISPMQIPFWFGWSTVLFTKKILSQKILFIIYIYWEWPGNFNGQLCFYFWWKIYC